MRTKRRIIFDKATGEIVCHTPEMETNFQLPTITELGYIDFELGYKSDEFMRATKMHIDVKKSDIVFDEFIANIVTPEQQIEDLQNQLLLAVNQNVEGGIF